MKIFIKIFCLFSCILFSAQVLAEQGGEISIEGSLKPHVKTPHNTFRKVGSYERPGNADTRQRAKKRGVKDNFSVTAEFDFRTKYVWRGLESSKGFVWQPSVTAELYGAGASIWANFVLDDEANQGQFNEVDFVPYYSFKLKELSITPSMEIYVYPNDNPSSLNYTAKTTVRTAVNISYPIWRFAVSFNGEVDLYSAKGAMYYILNVSYHQKIVESFGINTSIAFELADSRFNRAHIANVGTQLNLFSYVLSLSWNPWKQYYLMPNVRVSTLLPESLRSAVNKPTIVWGGIDMKYEF